MLQFALALPLAPLLCSPALQDEPYRPVVQEASSEGRDALVGVVVPEGFVLGLFAAEPLLANPVSFAIDAHMRFFVAETFRLDAGVTDMRRHMDWLPDELAARTVEDRVALTRRHEGEQFAEHYMLEQERVRCLVDLDGDGTAETSSVYADGFSDPAAGVAAGLLPVGDALYFACIPDMWRLWDRDGDRIAEDRERLSTGWGVHIALAGHDMHGLCRGPDGRLYWSIGDRGFHVEHEGRVLAHHHAGAVLRSELDGSGLEIFATGLRNPQDLVFDDHGNLFTGDNNSDGGDRARWVYLVQGGESGWRQAFQYITQPTLRGPWNAERLWEPAHEDQPSYLVPPVANFSDGPSGVAYYPGTGWGPEFRGSFFLCDFRGEAFYSGIHRFQVREQGAGFELVGAERFLWNCLPTDVQFGVDGVLYYTDWVHGWTTTGKGRIYSVSAGADEFADERREVQALLAAGMGERGCSELGALLAHGHQTVRAEAQWELAERALRRTGAEADASLEVLLASAEDKDAPLMARLHAIWGAGQVLRVNSDLAPRVWGRLAWLHGDEEDEVRAQWFKVLGDAAWPQAFASALHGLADPAPRVRFFAAQCLAAPMVSPPVTVQSRRADATRALVELLALEGDADPWMRHAAVRALAAQATPSLLERWVSDERLPVRRAVLLALRTQGAESVARFLQDPEPSLVAEAARAIYDRPIEGAMGSLAALLPTLLDADSSLVRRSMAAARRVHDGPAAQALADWTLATASEDLGSEALAHLLDWDEPSSIDPIMGEWRPLASGTSPRSPQLILSTGRRALEAGTWAAQRWTTWLRLAESEDGGSNPVVAALAEHGIEGESGVRRVALELALRGGHPRIDRLLALAADAEDPGLRIVALGAMAQEDPEQAVAQLAHWAESGQPQEARAALELLASIDSPRVEVHLVGWIDELAMDGGVGPLALDLEEAARRNGSPSLDQAMDRLRSARAQVDPAIGAWLFALEGGDPSRGRDVFLRKTETECLRCHAFAEEGGSEVGPDLTEVGTRLKPMELLRSVLRPNATIAEGFEDWMFSLSDGEVVVGRIVEEDDGWVQVETPQKEILDLEQREIEGRKRGLSSMPEDVSDALSPMELRDLVAFLKGCGR